MLRNVMRSLFAVAALALLQQAAMAADVSVHQVYEAAEAGRLTEAQTMMEQVLREHPNSARAHFVEAELLSKQGKLAAARAELTTAERLEPGLPFATPSAVQTLKERLSTQTVRTRTATEGSPGRRDVVGSRPVGRRSDDEGTPGCSP